MGMDKVKIWARVVAIAIVLPMAMMLVGCGDGKKKGAEAGTLSIGDVRVAINAIYDYVHGSPVADGLYASRTAIVPDGTTIEEYAKITLDGYVGGMAMLFTYDVKEGNGNVYGDTATLDMGAGGPENMKVDGFWFNTSVDKKNKNKNSITMNIRQSWVGTDMTQVIEIVDFNYDTKKDFKIKAIMGSVEDDQTREHTSIDLTVVNNVIDYFEEINFKTIVDAPAINQWNNLVTGQITEGEKYLIKDKVASHDESVELDDAKKVLKLDKDKLDGNVRNRTLSNVDTTTVAGMLDAYVTFMMENYGH